MKRFILSLVIVFGILLAVWACAEEDKEISWEEKYKDRPVAYLLIDKTIEVNEDWSFSSRRHCKIRVQKEEGKKWGEIPIYYNSSREEVTDIEAYTTTPDGQRHKYSQIQDFRVYEGYPMYSDYMLKVITMPAVVVGSTVEYEATRHCQGLPIAEQFWNCIYLDSRSPIKEYKVTVTFPKALNIQCKEFNNDYAPKIEETDTIIKYSWDLKDVEETELEEFRPPPNLDNITSSVEFSSIPAWRNISDWYYGLINKNMVINAEIENTAQDLVKDKKTIRDKVRTILEYIQDDFRYVSMSLGDHALEPHPTDEVFKNKYGDCKDLSLLCKAMLKVVGIESNMALFNNEFSITDPQYDLPLPTLFDHVLLEVEDPSGNFYVDPLLDGYDIGEYPISYQRAYTFVITEDGGRFGRFPIFDEQKVYSKAESLIEIKEDGSALVEKKSLWDLDDSVDFRDRWKALSQDDKEKLLHILETETNPGGKTIDWHWENIDNKYGPLRHYSKFEVPNAYPITDDIMIIYLSEHARGRSFTKEEREEPIFFPGNSLDEKTTTYILPEGFKVSYLPKDLDLDIGLFSLKRSYRKEDNRIIVDEIIRYSRQEIPPEKYKDIQNFYNNLPHKTNQRIIVRKISEQ